MKQSYENWFVEFINVVERKKSEKNKLEKMRNEIKASLLRVDHTIREKVSWETGEYTEVSQTHL